MPKNIMEFTDEAELLDHLAALCGEIDGLETQCRDKGLTVPQRPGKVKHGNHVDVIATAEGLESHRDKLNALLKDGAAEKKDEAQKPMTATQKCEAVRAGKSIEVAPVRYTGSTAKVLAAAGATTLDELRAKQRAARLAKV